MKNVRKGLGVVGCAAVLAVPFATSATASADAAERVDAASLRTEGQREPIGIGEDRPALSWQLDGSGSQTAYQVRAASSEGALRAGRPDLWDSGRVESSRSSGIDYAGEGLEARDRVVWQVRVWDADGTVGPWSDPARFELGLLARSDWSASWIENPAYDYKDAQGAANPLPVFGKEFAAKGKVARARLYMTGLGMYDARLNGKSVGDAVLEPGQTDYADRVAYRTYDVTGLVQDGANVLGIDTGSGAYQRVVTPGRYFFGGSLEQHVTYGEPKAIAQLELTYADGRKETVASDDTWRTRLGATTYSSWWGGEDRDARRLPLDWSADPGRLSDGAWSAAAEAALSGTTTPTDTTPLVADPRPPIRIHDTHRPTKITKAADGSYVLDFGANRAGFVALQLQGAAGTKVTATVAEELNDDGTIDQRSMTSGKEPVTYSYTLSGDGVERWRPQFTYNSFRYVRVDGLVDAPGPETVTQEVAYASNPESSTFDSSVPLLNQIRTITKRAIENNMHSVLTDTPNREKGPYTGDNLHNIDALLTDFDMSAYQPQLVQNMADAQRKAGDESPGLIANIAPEYHRVRPVQIPRPGGTIQFLDEMNWGGAIIRIPWKLYETYGDTRTLRRYYANMVAWMDYEAQNKAKGDFTGLGDWLAQDTTTPQQLPILYGYHRAADELSKIADLLGKDDDAAKYRALATEVGQEFNVRFRHEDGARVYYGSDSQTSNAMALDSGLVPAADRQAVLDSLVRRIEAEKHTMTGGSPALASLFHALHDGGRDDVLYRMVTNPSAPSYGGFVSNGFTTLPESFGTVPHDQNSKGHHYLGQVDHWLVSAVAGIGQADGSVGFDRLRIKPSVTGELDQASGSYETPHGTASSAWRKDGTGLRLTVRIPANSRAEVWVPVRDGQAVQVDGMARTVTRSEQGYRIYDVGPGEHEFVARDAAAPPTPPTAPTPPTPPVTTPQPPVAPSSRAIRLTATRTARASTLRRSGILATVRTPTATRLQLGLERGSKAWATATRTVSRPGIYRVRLRLNAAGRRAVRALRPGRTVTVKVTVRAPIDGRTRVAKQPLKVRG